MLWLNDIHIGFDRKGGTTPASQESLRGYLHAEFRTTLEESEDDHLVIVGDLFDDFEISARDWIQTYYTLSAWVLRNKMLTLVAGNHDWSPKGTKVSSFKVLCDVLVHGYGEMVQVINIDEGAVVAPGVVAIAHCSNQESFEGLLSVTMAVPPAYLLVHCNFDNKFAAQTDHSLNISYEKAREITEAGTTLVFAHEHIARKAFAGKVVVLGNQWPTSIIDCLGNTMKSAHRLVDDRIQTIATWSVEDPEGFAEVDWRELANPELCTAGFIRVVGKAGANEAADVINAIAKFRQKSGAYVISNAVDVDGVMSAEALPESFEAARRFDVMEYVRQHLESDEMAVVEGLLK